MVPAPIVIKLKPVQTKKIIATTHANPSRSPEFDDKPDFSPEMITNPARHDSNIAERTPIDEVILLIYAFFNIFWQIIQYNNNLWQKLSNFMQDE